MTCFSDDITGCYKNECYVGLNRRFEPGVIVPNFGDLSLRDGIIARMPGEQSNRE